MNFGKSEFMALIRQGEGLTLEFKDCAHGIARNVYESVCAFLNRHGGTLLLGVRDDGTVTGIAPAVLEQLKKDFVTAINNPQKLHPPAYLSVEDVEIEGKAALRIYVPESSQVHRCNGRIFDRNEDGDLDITDHTRQVADLYHRKQANYSENKIYPFAGLGELETDLLAKCRKIAVLRRDDHPWKNMDDLELLKSAQLYQTDPESGKSGVTLAGLLLLGKRSPLLSAVPHHRTDLILRKVNLDRYDDRDFVDVNLVESYDRIMAFVAKHLPDPFYLEGTTSICIRDTIFREVASNILIHREYMNAFPAKLIIERGQVRTENSNKPHGFGVLNPNTFTPFPKNPVIAGFFRQIGRADELGSGMRKMMRYGKAYGGADPELIEGDIFRIIIKVPEFSEPPKAGADIRQETGQTVIQQETGDVTGDVTGEVTGEVSAVLKALADTPLSRRLLREKLGLKGDDSFRVRYLEPAQAGKWIEMTQPDSPKSPTQKYRLTAKGKQLIAATTR